MNKKFSLCLAAVLLLLLVASLYAVNDDRFYRPVTITPPAKPRLTVVVVPLDSRPPCTQYVEQLAAIADIQVILPPTGLLGRYTAPADKTALRAWLKAAVKDADAAVVSTDMLIHGGLLASRFSSGTQEDAAATLALLADIHHSHPRLKLYVFNIIPRLLIADNYQNSLYQSKMLKYSLLKDQHLTFDNPSAFANLNKLETEIPSDIIARYLALNETNTALNRKLIDLAAQGVVAGLVIGQDDGQPFGLPNISKNSLNRYLQASPDLTGKVFITRGTDEVALTLLGRAALQSAGQRPRIFVQYSYPAAESVVMPFMPHSVARTVEEKIAVAGAVRAASPDEADFILYIHVGTQKTNTALLVLAARQVEKLLQEGRKVALVDLSEDYYGHEALLPYLLQAGIPINRLAAYAGWNTTSNSIGTAITQAALFALSLQTDRTLPHLVRVYQYNLEFLTARFLDDWYYQKDVQAIVKRELHNVRIDANNLAGHYPQVNRLVGRLMAERADMLCRRALLKKPVYIDSDEGTRKLAVVEFQPRFELPWERIFEIRVLPSLTLAVDEREGR